MNGGIRATSVERHYDLLVEEGDDPVHDPPELRECMDRYDGESFFAQLGDIDGLRVLEIGVGTGRLATRILKLQPALLVGIDVSGNALARCRQNTGNPQNLELQKAVFPDWQTEHVFDIVYSSQTFMHIENLYGALLKICDVLSPNGRAVISFANCGPSVELRDRRVPLYRHEPAEIQATADRCRFASTIQELPDEKGIVAWLWTGTKKDAAAGITEGNTCD